MRGKNPWLSPFRNSKRKVGRVRCLAELLYLREALRGSFATLSKRFKLPVE